MKSYYYVFILILLLICFGCQHNETPQTKPYTCKDYKLEVPIESVDAETNGQKSGETHFHSPSAETEVFYSYNLLESAEKALEALNRIEKNSPSSVMRKGELKDSNGKKVGEKLVILTKEGYELWWINGSMSHSLKSESLSTIEEIEKGCNL